MATGPQNESQRQLAYFQQNLKKTALGVKFGKKLFTDPKSLTSKQLIEVSRALGLNVPKEAMITADVIQIYATGAAAVDSYQTYQAAVEAGQTATDLSDVVKPSAAAFRLATNIAEDNNMIDSDSASMMRAGLAVAMIVASGGADVSSWIALGTELIAQSEGAKIEAKMLAMKAAQRQYTSKLDQEKVDLAKSIKKLEAGEIGIFGFLVEFANKGNLMFENAIIKNPKLDVLRQKLPGLNFIPTGTWTFKGSGSKTTWYGDTKTDDAEFSVEGLYSVPPEKAFDQFFKWVISPYADGYMIADRLYRSMGKASLFETAILGLFQENARIDTGQNVLTEFLKAQITPYEIGIKDTFDKFQQFPPSRFEAIVSNFGLKQMRQTYSKEQMIYLDQAGRINDISKVRESADLLTDKFDFMKTALDLNINKTFVDFRNVANFIAVLDMLDLVYSDPMYKEWIKSSEVLPAYDVFPKIKDFKAKFELCWKYSTIRKVNQLALGNVQYFMGSTNIEMKNKNEFGPAIYGYTK